MRRTSEQENYTQSSAGVGDARRKKNRDGTTTKEPAVKRREKATRVRGLREKNTKIWSKDEKN